jgi:hypothetical protein
VLGSRPVVFIFARKMDDNLASLVKQLDKIVGANKANKAASVVNFLGEETDDVITSAKKFGKQHKVKNIALVVPRPSFNGPPSFKVSEQAELTVMLYKGRRIVGNHAVAAGKLDKKKVDSIVKDATGLFK